MSEHSFTVLVATTKGVAKKNLAKVAPAVESPATFNFFWNMNRNA